MIPRPGGIAFRIALAALAVALLAVAIMAVGVFVLGAQSFEDLMVEHGESTEASREMFMDSVGWVVAGTIVVAFVAAFVLASFLGARLAVPLRDIGRVARQLADGDYSARIPRRGPEEIVSLSDSVNQMAMALEDQERMRREFVNDTAQLVRDFQIIRAQDLSNVRASFDGFQRVTGEQLMQTRDAITRVNRVIEAGQVVPASLR